MMKSVKITDSLSTALFLSFFVAASCLFFAPSNAMALNNVDVAIYNDTAYPDGGAWQEGLDSIKEMLSQYGYTYEDITSETINNTRNLTEYYEILIFGGGWAGDYNTYIQESGYQNIREFVLQGGGFFGICAGSYLASDVVVWQGNSYSPVEVYGAEYQLDLFPGIARGSLFGIIGWDESTGCAAGITEGAEMTTVSIDTSLLPGVSSELEILYYGGPMFHPFYNQLDNITVIGRYNVPGDHFIDQRPAMILFSYGEGQVFLTGPHPEVSFYNCNVGCQNGLCDNNWQLMDEILTILLGNEPTF